MKLTFLGTSHGVTAPDRYCQCMLLEIGENRYLIDAGAPVADILTRNNIPFDSIKGVFITHMHGDHAGGLYQFLDLCSWYYKTASVDVYLPEEAGVAAFDAMMSTILNIQYDKERVRLHTMQEGLVFDDGILRVSAFPTEHLQGQNRPSYGYLIEANGKRLYISGDLKYPDAADYPAFLNQEETDLLVIECAHFPAEVLFQKIKDCKAKQIAITHVFPVSKYEEFPTLEQQYDLYPVYPSDGSTYEL